MVTLPDLDGVDHKYVDLGDGVTIHVADAGPAEGPAGDADARLPRELVGVARVDLTTGRRRLPRAVPRFAWCGLEFGAAPFHSAAAGAAIGAAGAIGVGDTKPEGDDVGDKLDVAEGIQGESRILHRSQDRRDGNIATRNINRASQIRPMARCKKCPSELQLPGSAQCARARISWPAPAWPWPRWRRRLPASIPRARSPCGTSPARR